MGREARVTAAADIFAIGMIGAWLLTGLPVPYLTAVRDCFETTLVENGVSADVATALLRCLATNPEQRPSAAQLVGLFGEGIAWWRRTGAAVGGSSEPAIVISSPTRPAAAAASFSPLAVSLSPVAATGAGSDAVCFSRPSSAICADVRAG
jgi:hypothetical protein